MGATFNYFYLTLLLYKGWSHGAQSTAHFQQGSFCRPTMGRLLCVRWSPDTTQPTDADVKMNGETHISIWRQEILAHKAV